MHSESDFIDRASKLSDWVARDALTINQAALQYMDRLGDHPSLVCQTYQMLFPAIQHELERIARSSDSDWYESFFSILTDPVGTRVERIEIDNSDPPNIYLVSRIGSDTIQRSEIELTHPARVALNTIREYLSNGNPSGNAR